MSMLVVAAVLSVFAVFAIVLIWGDFQTRPAQRKPQWIPQRPRSSEQGHRRSRGSC